MRWHFITGHERGLAILRDTTSSGSELVPIPSIRIVRCLRASRKCHGRTKGISSSDIFSFSSPQFPFTCPFIGHPFLPHLIRLPSFQQLAHYPTMTILDSLKPSNIEIPMPKVAPQGDGKKTPKTPQDEAISFFSREGDGEPVQVWELSLEDDGGPSPEKSVSLYVPCRTAE